MNPIPTFAQSRRRHGCIQSSKPGRLRETHSEGKVSKNYVSQGGEVLTEFHLLFVAGEICSPRMKSCY
jgi:hypothetical protein